MLLAALLLSFASPSPSFAEAVLSAPIPVKCGGNYDGEELEFRRNPINGVLSAVTKDEDLMVFVDVSRAAMPHLTFGEVVKDAEWERLKALRDSSSDEAFRELLSRLGSMKVTDLWAGWSGDGYLLIETQQRGKKLTFACQKL